MKYLDPRKHPNHWLYLTLCDLVHSTDPQDRQALTDALHDLVGYMEPGLIDQLFQPWIDKYLTLLDEQENSQSTDQTPYWREDRSELSV